MKLKKNIPLFIIFCVLLTLLYILLNFKPLSTEVILTPEWTFDITKVPQKPQKGEKLLPYKLGKTAGYFTREGKLVSATRFNYKITISPLLCAPYEQNAQNIPVMDPFGNEVCTIQGSGFPFVQENRIFLFLPGGSSVAFCGLDGNQTALYEYTVPITAFNSSEYGTIIGFADGALCTFTKDGHLNKELLPGGSDFSVILGADISKKGKLCACISGQSKQRFVLYALEETHAKIIFHEFFDEDLTRQTFVHFSNNEKFVYYNYKDGLGIVNTEDLSCVHIPIKGQVLDIQETPISNTVFVLSRQNDIYTVTIFESYNSKIGDFSFKANTAFILTDGNALFIGRDTKISRITLSKE